MELPEEARKMGAPPNWMSYVCVPDVDATAARVVELGGQLMAPAFDIPEVGRIGIIGDPQGAVLGIFAHAGDEMDAMSGVGTVVWHELLTSDPTGAWSFYSELFGWEKTDAMDMGPGGTYQMYGVPGSGGSLGGFMQKPAEIPGPSCWLYYINVADLDAALVMVRELGGQVQSGPMVVPGPSGDRIAQCIDSQGAFFALHEAGGQ